MLIIADDLHEQGTGLRILTGELAGAYSPSGEGKFFCVYDEKFIRRHDDDQPQIHAQCVAGPRWEYDHLRAGPPVNWPKISGWEEGFDLTEADDEYAEVHPYAEPRY